MALEDIISKINEDASLEVDEILKKARNKAKEIISLGTKEAEKIKENIIKKALDEEQKNKDSALALANLEARKNILEFKQSVISGIYNKVLEDLRNLSLQDYQNLIRNILLENASGEEEIIISSSDEDKINQPVASPLGEQFINMVNQKLVDKGKKGNLSLYSERRNFNGGFILRRGKLEMNYSFTNLVNNLRDKTESEVIKILFGNI